MMRISIFSLVVACLLSGASAFPWYWINATNTADRCGKHPEMAYKVHGAPMNDTGINFVVMDMNTSTMATQLCPGGTYNVQATWVNATHRALLTTSAGEWAPIGTTNSRAYLAAESCKQATFLTQNGNTVNNTMVVPCDAPDGPVMLMLTHGAPGVAYMQGSMSININASCAPTNCTTPASLWPPAGSVLLPPAPGSVSVTAPPPGAAATPPPPPRATGSVSKMVVTQVLAGLILSALVCLVAF